MTHICVSKLTIIGSDNGLSPDRRQAIIWTNAGILLNGPLGTNFSEISIEILTFSFKKMHLKVSSAKRRPFCLGLNVLKVNGIMTTLCFSVWFYVCVLQVGWKPLFPRADEPWLKALNLFHPVVVLLIIIFGYVVQWEGCFGYSKERWVGWIDCYTFLLVTLSDWCLNKMAAILQTALTIYFIERKFSFSFSFKFL